VAVLAQEIDHGPKEEHLFGRDDVEPQAQGEILLAGDLIKRQRGWSSKVYAWSFPLMHQPHPGAIKYQPFVLDCEGNC